MPFDPFDLLAPAFDRAAPLQFSRTQLDLLGLPCTGCLLDAGGGTGRIALALRNLVGGAMVADPSCGMLRRAAARGMTAVCSRAERLPFLDAAFERIVMRDAFHHLADPRRSAGELWRLLAPGGRVVIIEPDIDRWAIKLVALGEKLLLMRSHFRTAERILDLFPSAGRRERILREAAEVWIILEKVKQV